MSADPGLVVLRELRNRRRRNRLRDLEWFDAAYKVYLVAIFGGGAVLWLSELVGDTEAAPAQVRDVLVHGPAVLGLVAAFAFALGLRSGSQGGPLALETADVVHVMLAPVDRRRALWRPAVQRIRSALFAGVVLGGIAGQLAGRRLPGSALAWCGSGALYGASVALLWVGAALLAHALRLPLRWATALSLVVLGWQTAAVVTDVPGPANLDGSLALWGLRQRAIDLAAPAIAIAVTVVGLLLVGRTSIEALVRRSGLVAQLRFAVTMQDLRTVILLRRQLAHERTRRRPWLRLPRTQGRIVWRRGWASLLRFPAGRVLRMALLAAAAGVCHAAVFHGTTPAAVLAAVLGFVLGMEVLEPLSQEIDQPDRTDSYPVERGELHWAHLRAPAVALAPFALIGAAAGLVVHAIAGGDGGYAVAAIAMLPATLAGAAGAAVSIVRDARDPFGESAREAFLPPEMAGAATALRTLIPLVVSVVGTLPVVFARESAAQPVGGAIRGALAATLVVAGVAMYVRTRDRVRSSVRNFLDEGRRARTAPRTT